MFIGDNGGDVHDGLAIQKNRSVIEGCVLRKAISSSLMSSLSYARLVLTICIYRHMPNFSFKNSVASSTRAHSG